MRERIEPLISERAPWLNMPGVAFSSTRLLLDYVLGYEAAVALAEHLKPFDAPKVMDDVAARLAKRVEITGLSNVPCNGPAIVVANHPTGIGDGIVLWHVLTQIRRDIFFYANSDILRVLPQMAEVIAPVEWRQEKRSHQKTRATMAFTRSAFDAGKLGVIFPSGRLAKRRGLTLHEREWLNSAASLARKFSLPIIPINIQARNSCLFYLFDRVHPTLRDITLFHETLNKDRQRFRINIGQQVAATSLPDAPDAATALLRRRTLEAGDPRIAANTVPSAASLHWIAAQLR